MTRTLAILFLIVGNAMGATVYFSDGSLSDTQTLADNATDGDVVQLPAGSFNYTGQLKITKRITLKGAGQNLTFITCNWAASTGNDFNIHYYTVGTSLVECSDMTLIRGTSNGNASGLLGIGFISSTNLFSVHHLTLTNLNHGGIVPQGWVPGSVIDHCKFYGAVGEAPTAVSINGLWTGYGVNQSAWYKPTEWGSTNAGVTIEDCVFSFAGNANGCVDCYYAGSFVFRFNSVTNVNVGDHGLDSTGVDSTRNWEVYGNTFINTTVSTVNTFFSFRGGTGIICSNTVAGLAGDIISLQNYRANTTIYGGPCCNPWGPVGSTNVYDGPGPYPYSYPPYEQIGQSSPITNYASGGPGNRAYRQGPTVPVYVWENWHGGIAVTAIVGNVSLNTGTNSYIPRVDEIIIEGRDYTNGVAKPGWTPFTYPHPLVAARTASPVIPPVVIGGNVIMRGGVSLKVFQ